MAAPPRANEGTHEGTQHCIKVTVKDTGIGISEAAQKKLFGMFMKIKDARVRNPLGVGLGLAICKQLVELMGGQIWVESEYGMGSEFTFTIMVERAGTEDDLQLVEETAQQHQQDLALDVSANAAAEGGSESERGREHPGGGGQRVQHGGGQDDARVAGAHGDRRMGRLRVHRAPL